MDDYEFFYTTLSDLGGDAAAFDYEPDFDDPEYTQRLWARLEVSR